MHEPSLMPRYNKYVSGYVQRCIVFAVRCISTSEDCAAPHSNISMVHRGPERTLKKNLLRKLQFYKQPSVLDTAIKNI